MEQSNHSRSITPTHEAEVYIDVPKSNDETKTKVVTFDTEPKPIKVAVDTEPKAKADPFFEGSTAGVPGVEMDHTKIDNKSGVGVGSEPKKTLPTLCASLSSSRLYKRRMDANNHI